MTEHRVVSREEWIEARRGLQALEAAYLREAERVRRQRMELPWVPVRKEYLFDTPGGRKTLADLFDGRSQLIVHHLMLAPGWEQACDGCSFLADHVPGALPHLRGHDVNFVAVSRAPLAEIEVFKQRMDWPFTWVSSYGSSFNSDYHVSYTQQDIDAGKPFSYNYPDEPVYPDEEIELHGLSSFYRDDSGTVYHTYSTYARGGEILINAYNYLDITPKGRNEDQIMGWMKLHDTYEVPEPARV